MIVLQGPLELLFERLGELGCLPLAERTLRLGSARNGTAARGDPRSGDGGHGAGLCAGSGGLLRGGGRSWCCSVRCRCARPMTMIEWPILVMLGALIPVARCAADHRRDPHHRRLAGPRSSHAALPGAPWR